MLARKIILGFGFAMLVPLLIHYGVELLLPERSWSYDSSYYNEHEKLVRAEANATTPEERARIRLRLNHLEQTNAAQTASREQIEEQARLYHFFIGAPLGILITLAGSFILVQAVGGGLMLGGIVTFTEGCCWYWRDVQRLGKFSILLVAFAVLLWIGYQRLSELKQPPRAT